MTIAVVGTPITAGSQAANAVTLAQPAGLADGDLLVAVIGGQGGTATADYVCAGFTRVGPVFTSNGSIRACGIYVKSVPTASAETATSYAFAGSPGTSRTVGAMFIVRGADLANISAGFPPASDGTGYSYFGSAASGSMTVGTSPAKDSLLLLCLDTQSTAGQHWQATVPGMTQQVATTQPVAAPDPATASTTALTVWSTNVAASTAAGPYTATLGGNVSAGTLFGVFLTDAGGGVNPDTHRPVYYTDTVGHAAQAKGAYYTPDGATLTEATEMRPFPDGYGTIAAMLATSPWYMAHRGGSDDWPEMSLHAYTQAGYWGAGALEVSVARTSDGVLFGLHDQYLDRTSLGVAAGTTLNASAMTWAQVQAYNVLDPKGGAPKPYMELSELLAAYPGHVIFVDPKYIAATYYDGIVSTLLAQPGGTSRFVAKSYGVGDGGGWATAARNAGFKTWGYYYEADAANITTWQSYYDWLGMNYTAAQAAWDTVNSFGKPVIGHICPDAASITTALSKGAVGVMVSGVTEAIPRTA